MQGVDNNTLNASNPAAKAATNKPASNPAAKAVDTQQMDIDALFKQVAELKAKLENKTNEESDSQKRVFVADSLPKKPVKYTGSDEALKDTVWTFTAPTFYFQGQTRSASSVAKDQKLFNALVDSINESGSTLLVQA